MDLFPFEQKREKQGELIEEITETINKSSSIIAHAPTGLGKTAAAVTPALEHVKENGGKVFFLTPRHSQHEIALEAVKKINSEHNEKIVSVDLIGRSHLCEADSVTTEGPKCPRHNETFENGKLSNKTISKINQLKHRNLRAEEVKQACREVCAYTVSLNMCKDADIIIADYFHIFHPSIREVILEHAQTNLEDCIIVVDEAHNLPSRTRSLYSHTISVSLIEKAIIETEKFGYYQEQQNLEQLKNEINRLARNKLGLKDNEAEITKSDLKDPVDNFHSFEELIIDLDAAGEEVMEEEEKSYCAKLAESLDGWKGPEKGFFRSIEKNRNGTERTIRAKYSCLDPSISTSDPLNNCKASILMSATLKPQAMYSDLLGLGEHNSVEFKSPFPEQNRVQLAVNTVTTRYKERDDAMIQKYAWYLAKSLEEIEGNAAVFMPSYHLLNQIKENLEPRTDREILAEDRRMNKKEKQRMLDNYQKNSGDGLLLMGVASGSFGEGVDYPGEMMKAVFIVGLPLRRPSLQTEALVDYLDEKFGKGWQYGYTYPAINAATQAAGRCIRSKTDTGIIVYMDKRYTWSKYKKLLENPNEIIETRAPWKQIEKFQDNGSSE